MRKTIFGLVCVPLDRNQKARLLHRARCLMRASEKGRHYGPVTAKAYAVFAALLMGFHNNASGRCFPSSKRIAEGAACCERTVAAAIAALEAAALLGVANRLMRVRWRDELSREPDRHDRQEPETPRSHQCVPHAHSVHGRRGQVESV